MKTRRHLACAAAALVMLSCWLAHPVRQRTASAVPAAAPLVQAGRTTSPINATRATTKPLLHPGWSRAEAAKYLQAYFSKEQLRAELELEQLRYRGQYWETEPGLAELQEIESRRGERLKRLTTEMNGLLADTCPGEAGEPLALAAFFSLDQPGPNLAFLSGESREKMEDAMLAFARDGSLDASRLMEIAGRTLSVAELADYSHWNAPASAALRNRLAGYSPDEEEFAAILKWQSTAGSDGEAEARVELERGIGPERLAQWEAQNEPAASTALQDLHRLGRPLESATWLADFRSQAAAQLQKSWGNPALTDAQKQAQVEAMRNVFRDELSMQLDLPAADADLLP